MRLFLAVVGAVVGLGILEMVCSQSVQMSVLPGFDVGQPSGGGFVSKVLSLPRRVVSGIFKAIGSVLRFIFVGIPEAFIDLIKRIFYRVASVFGKRDPYDMPPPPAQGGYNHQTSYKTYNPGYYGGVYRNPYGTISR